MIDLKEHATRGGRCGAVYRANQNCPALACTRTRGHEGAHGDMDATRPPVISLDAAASSLIRDALRYRLDALYSRAGDIRRDRMSEEAAEALIAEAQRVGEVLDALGEQ